MRVWLCITRPESCRKYETGVIGELNHTTEELHNVEILTSGNMNGVKESSLLESSNGRAQPIAGKRKERSPSPSKALAD